MKKVIVLIMFLLNASFSFSQQNLHLKLDDKPTKSLSTYLNSMRKSAIRLNYNPLAGFLNPTYFNNNDNGTIKYKGGYGFAIQQRIWLFRLDLGASFNYYDVKDLSYQEYYGVDDAVSGGVDVFVAYNLMPYWGKISEILEPYIGIGYQTASIEAIQSKKKSTISGGSKTEQKTVGSLGIGGFAWESGLNINFGKKFFLFGEYRQSINMKSTKALRSLSVGLGIGF